MTLAWDLSVHLAYGAGPGAMFWLLVGLIDSDLDQRDGLGLAAPQASPIPNPCSHRRMHVRQLERVQGWKRGVLMRTRGLAADFGGD